MNTSKEKLPCYYKNISLGFKTLKEGIKGTYINKKCPFTGNVSIKMSSYSGFILPHCTMCFLKLI
uniref:Small ribosomal subunit protein uS17 N-terminal domain-containing protein n=1 Tax=Anolis carolinensis TaxID=28377 RepID=A0A803U1P1_ANOCA